VGPTDQPARTRVDVDGVANLDLLDKFCYLDNMLSLDGDANAAFEASAQKGRHKRSSWSFCLPISQEVNEQGSK